MQHWSEAYLTWTGDFEALVAKANEVLKNLNPPLEGVTESLVRHYQSKNLVGRGIKKGRQAFFDVADLRAVVETKSLAQDGWGLEKIAQIYQTSSNVLENSNPTRAMEVVRGLMGKSAQSSLTNSSMLLKTASSLPNSPLFSDPLKVAPSFSGSTLMDLSEKDCAANYSSSNENFKLKNSGAFASAALESNALSLHLASQSTSGLRHELNPAPWLKVYIDPRQLDNASLEEIEKACNSIKDWCQSQKWVSSSRSSS